ncbi:uncharacterized protein K02A2.6-like [Anoplophora glabripennis]|uniref:uncharacterized protein K02A2.6-like n=1 Tax=Anoplophora glabripennis TaxID=217634 RepID=UPI000873B68F|nr:uncharacterized protein K02A2.6-like [Anoplophora glabripennis]
MVRSIEEARENTLRIPPTFVQPITINQIDDQNLPLYKVIVRAQKDSPEYAATKIRIRRLQQGKEPADVPWKQTLMENYEVKDDLVCLDAGHPGRDETIRSIGLLYYWPSMRRQVKTHERYCLLCAASKRGGAWQEKAPLKPRPPQRPWQVVSVDIMGPYSQTKKKNRFLIVLTDICSKWVEALPVPKVRPRILIDFMENICQQWGYPERVISDNGSTFKSGVWTRYLQGKFINQYFFPIYHQRSNPVERRNQELKKLLRLYCKPREENQWDAAINQALFTLRNRTNSATGMSPSTVLLGAGEWGHPELGQRIENPRPKVQFQVGDRVLVRCHPGTQIPVGLPWSGPYRIVRVCGLNVYEVDRAGPLVLLHVDDLRPWKDRPEDREVERNPLHIPEEDETPDDALLNLDEVQYSRTNRTGPTIGSFR